MNKDKVKVILAGMFMTLLLASPAYSDSTAVLPQGRSMVSVGHMMSNVDREYDDSGSNRELGYYFNEVDVTRLATPAFNELLGLPAGTPSVSLAMTYLDAEVSLDVVTFSYQYGVTDNLTLAVGFPYFTRARTDVKFQALIWPNTLLGLPAGPLDLTADAQRILTDSFGYEKLESWQGDPGIGDIQVGAKYRFINDDTFKAATGGWLTIPTGETDDERNLTDVRYGFGSYDTGVFLMADMVPNENLLLNVTGRYVVTFPYHRGIYMLDKEDEQFYKAELPTMHVFGDYDRGDWYELETEVKITLAPGVEFYTGYWYMDQESDHIDGDLVPKSAVIDRKVFGGVSLSTVEAFVEGEASVPVILDLYAEASQSGRNTERAERFFTTLKFFF